MDLLLILMAYWPVKSIVPIISPQSQCHISIVRAQYLVNYLKKNSQKRVLEACIHIQIIFKNPKHISAWIGIQ